jgi:predicted dehydrogenase
LDQGVHLADLIHGVAGLPVRGVAFLQTAVWPLAPLEDNAYGLFHFADGVIAQFHVSMTQWKNLFSFEVHGELGSVAAEGLGGSYGEERLVRVMRRLEGGVPEVREERFPGPDRSWALEWDDFVGALDTGWLRHGGVGDGLAAMRMIDALYRSSASGAVEEV